MAINFTNKGFLNFNKEYNKATSNYMTASMSVSNKQKDGNYTNGYQRVFIPKKLLKTAQKVIKDKTLVDLEGFATVGKKSYLDFVLTDIKPSESKDNDEEVDLPF